MSDSDPADVIDAQDARLEIFVRMNEDSEKDYGFSVGINDTFESLLNIFKVLKISLRPNCFYKHQPVGFKVSVDPGYLTDAGGLLYTDDAAKHTKTVELTDKISDFAWPGQLILPIWEKDRKQQLIVFFGLLTWLYTDLPDFISPTPGICLTNQASRLLGHILLKFDLDKLAEDILSETAVNAASVTAQSVFFGFHVVKILFIYLVLWSGMLNPYSFNPIKVYLLNKNDKFDESKRDQLISIGWTSTRKATLDEYREYLKDTEIKKYGSIVKASKNGLFDKLKSPVIKLGKGEGFDSPIIDNKSTLKDLEANPTKYVLNYEIYSEIGECFEDYLSTKSKNVNQDIKNFRKFGPMFTTERLAKIIQQRRAYQKEKEQDVTDKKQK